MSSQPLTIKTSKLRGPVEDIPGLTDYLVGLGYATTQYVDDEVNANGVSLQAFASNASNLTTGTVPIARIPTGTTGTTVAIGNHTHDALYQPLDSDLTAIAALTTTSAGRSLLTESLSPGGSGALARLTSPTFVTPTLGVASATSLTASGGITFSNQPNSGVSTQITASSPIASYSAIKISPIAGTNAAAALDLIGRGTFGVNGVRAQIAVYGTDANADPANYEFAAFRAASNLFTLTSGKAGTGSNRPFMLSSGFGTDGTTNANQLYLATSGNVLIGTATDGSGKLQVNGDIATNGVTKFSGYPTGLLPAAASNAGSITYDTTISKHVGCNGSSWNALW